MYLYVDVYLHFLYTSIPYFPKILRPAGLYSQQNFWILGVLGVHTLGPHHSGAGAGSFFVRVYIRRALLFGAYNAAPNVGKFSCVEKLHILQRGTRPELEAWESRRLRA